MNSKPIGIFDSGLGGLTVLSKISQSLPKENIIYLGDNARVPYGNRSKETIMRFSFEDANFLIEKNVKCIVIACNTASALAGTELKKQIEIPVFDVITPALADAKITSKSGKIGVIGTRGTISSGAYSLPFLKACPLFVPFIEENEINSPALKLIVKDYLSEFKDKDLDTLILGCTHYPLIKDLIQQEIGDRVKIIDPGESVAIDVKKYLAKENMLNNSPKMGNKKYFVTDYTDRFIKIAELFLGHKIENSLEKVVL